MEGKKLYKSKSDKKICGVCGGLAEYLDVDATLIRLGCVLFGVFGAGLLVYIVAAIIMPDKPVEPLEVPHTEEPKATADAAESNDQNGPTELI